MIKKFSRWLLYKRLGWTADVNVELPEKCVICLAPHTSNWDFVYSMLYGKAEGLKSNFLMKKEWFFWPLGPLFRRLGGIPVYRDRNTSMTDTLAQAAKERKDFCLCITPEGTRSLNPDWKKGFYYIALKAGIPILLYALDFEHKEIRCTRSIMPSGDIDADMREIKLYFKDVKGKNPEQFSIGEID